MDRIVCGKEYAHLKERLLRTQDLNLDKCVDMCWASEITKVGLSVLDGVTASIPVNKINKRSRKHTEFKKQVSDKQKHKQCKYCGKYHEMKREKCPAYGQTCRKCNKLNHFENKCTASTKHGPTVKKKVNTVDFGDSSDSDDYYQSNSVVSSDVVGTVNSLSCKTSHSTMLIQGQKKLFQELRVI